MTLGYDACLLHRVKDITHVVSDQHNLFNPIMTTSPTSSVDPLAVLQRMRQITDTTSDTALAQALHVTTGAVSNWRQRGVIPYQMCANLAEAYGVSLDWLVFGVTPSNTTAEVCAELPPLRTVSERAARVTQFVLEFDAAHGGDDMIWLEQQLKRAVPEYAAWLAKQTN